MLANTKAEVTPINPKKGAEAGQVSISTDMIAKCYLLCKVYKKGTANEGRRSLCK